MKLQFRYRFEAAHRFLNSDSIPCMTPHGHTWHATLCIRFKDSELNDSMMTVEFSQIKKQWKVLIQETFDHSYLHNIQDPVVEVLRQESRPTRLLPFPGDPTTELISLFMFHKMELILQESSFVTLVEVESILLEETPTNSIVCDRNFYLSQKKTLETQGGWWTQTDPLNRDYLSNA